MMEINIDNQKEPLKLGASRCWLWPLLGVLLTFLAGFLFNYLVKDFRERWESISSILNALFIFLGLYFIFRNFVVYTSYHRLNLLLHTAAGVLLNAGLAMLLFINGLANYYFNTATHAPLVQPTDKGSLSKPYQGLYPDKLDVWIDLVPACQHGSLEDMDNYWTLVTALRSPELNIRGISTVFGKRDTGPTNNPEPALLTEIMTNLGIAAAAANTHEAIVDKIDKKATKKSGMEQSSVSAQPLPSLPPLYLGSMGPGTPYWPMTTASTELANSLTHQHLTIIALGPLTNIATVLKHHPELAPQIDRIILLAGRQPNDILFAGKQWYHQFQPVNAALDTVAANVVLYSGVPLVLVPFDLATRMPVTSADLAALKEGDLAAQWLGRKSQTWLEHWQNVLHRPGFHAFNWLTVSYAVMPELFSCRPMSARIGFNLFLEPFGVGRNIELVPNPKGPQVIYCYTMDTSLKQQLLNRIKGTLPVGKPLPVKE